MYSDCLWKIGFKETEFYIKIYSCNKYNKQNAAISSAMQLLSP